MKIQHTIDGVEEEPMGYPLEWRSNTEIPPYWSTWDSRRPGQPVVLIFHNCMEIKIWRNLTTRAGSVQTRRNFENWQTCEQKNVVACPLSHATRSLGMAAKGSPRRNSTSRQSLPLHPSLKGEQSGCKIASRDRIYFFFALIWIAPPNRVLFSSKAKGATFAPHYKLVPAPQGLHVRLNLDNLKATNKQSGYWEWTGKNGRWCAGTPKQSIILADQAADNSV